MGHSGPIFLYFCLFYKQLTAHNCSEKVADERIRTWILWSRNRLYHNHCSNISVILRYGQFKQSDRLKSLTQPIRLLKISKVKFFAENFGSDPGSNRLSRSKCFWLKARSITLNESYTFWFERIFQRKV